MREPDPETRYGQFVEVVSMGGASVEAEFLARVSYEHARGQFEITGISIRRAFRQGQTVVADKGVGWRDAQILLDMMHYEERGRLIDAAMADAGMRE